MIEYDTKTDKSPSIRPGFVTWAGLSAYSSCSKRWLQSHVPSSLRFKLDGKVLIKIQDFDLWMERHRQGQDIDRLLTEVLSERELIKSRGR